MPVLVTDGNHLCSTPFPYTVLHLTIRGFICALSSTSAMSAAHRQKRTLFHSTEGMWNAILPHHAENNESKDHVKDQVFKFLTVYA